MLFARPVVEPRSLAIGAVLGLGVLCGCGLAGRDDGTIAAKRIEIVDESGKARIVLGMPRNSNDPGGTEYGICVRAAEPPFHRIEIGSYDRGIAALKPSDESTLDRILLAVEPGPLGAATFRLRFPETGEDAVAARVKNTAFPSLEAFDKDGTAIFSVPRE
jgi:hypothetical protein